MQPRSRESHSIPESLNRRLNHYAWLAGAAGMSLLAVPKSAQAEIIYTPTNVTVQAPGGTYNLDLDNDGTADFIFHGFGDGVVNAFIEIDVTGSGEGVQYWKTCHGTLGTYCSYAAALPRGAKIPGQRIAGNGVILEVANASFPDVGFWQNVNSHFLGLKFRISGQTHYAWARMNVRTQGASVTAQITGYAYETVANQPILAGQTMGTSAASVPGSLGSLARGAK